MSLRRKVLVAVGLTLIILILGVYWISTSILMRKFSHLEAHDVEHHLACVGEVLTSELDHLSSKAADWAMWDDSYTFIEDANDKFIKSNLGDATFAELDLHAILFIHQSGRIVFSKAFDPQEGRQIPLCDELVRVVETHPSLVAHPDEQSVKTGMVMLQQNTPHMIVSRPIITSERKGPIRGTLIFARHLDDSLVQRLATLTHQSLNIYRIDDPQVPEDVRKASRALAKSRSYVLPINRDSVAAYTLYNDLYGNPALVIRITRPRDIYAQGQKTVLFLVSCLLFAGLAFGIVIIFLLERLILRRLTRLASEIRDIGFSGVLSVRLSSTGHDEFSTVGSAVNDTLGALERAQQELYENQRALSTLISNLPGMAFRCADDDNWTMQFISDGCLKLTGYYPSDLIGNRTISYKDLIHPDDRKRIQKEVRSALLKDLPFQITYRIRGANGEEKWVLEQGCGVYSPNGEFLALEGFVADITDRRRAENRVRLQSSALEAAANGIVITNRDGKIIWVNEAFVRLTGYKFDEAFGQNPRLLKSGKHDPSFYAAMWQTILAGQPWQGELVNKRKDGSLYTESMTITPVRDQNGEIAHFVAIQEDITSRKHLEEQVLQMQKMETIGKLAGGVAHDFNNILTAISGYNELMLSKLRTDDPQHRLAEEIGKAANRAANLTRQLLAFSRKQVLQPRVLDLGSLVAGLDKMLRRVIGEHVVLHSICAGDTGSVKADPGQIEQVILNLAVNARDAMARTGTLSIEVKNVDLDEDYARQHNNVPAGSYVMLAISDTGCGMSKEVQSHLFEPFFTTKPQGQGTGLGLATCYGIIKQSGGHITVYSEPSRGSTFKIYLPRVEEPINTPPPHRVVDLPKGRETVLVAEDEPAVRELAVCMLRDLGYSVFEASDGREGQRIAKQLLNNRLDLLLTDVVMPNMSGKELADWFRSSRPDAKILFTSGYTADAISQHGVLLDNVSFLEKPFTPSTLARKVREVLDAS